MAVEMREKYLEALGVPAVLYENSHAKNPTVEKTVEKIKTKCLVLETQNNQSFCQAGESQNLLLKMLKSIDLAPADFKCLSISAEDLSLTLSGYQAKTVLLLSADLPYQKGHFSTHHPSQILNDDKLKREAWEVLKSLKKCLK